MPSSSNLPRAGRPPKVESLPAYMVTVKGVDYTFIVRGGEIVSPNKVGNSVDRDYAHSLVKKEVGA